MEIKLVCPICGHPFYPTDMDESSVHGVGEEDDQWSGEESVTTYQCDYCGSGAEVWECPESERKQYPFYQKQNGRGNTDTDKNG